MKRGWMIALLLAFVLLFTGCSGGTEQVDASEEAVFEEWRTDVVTVSYMDVSFSVPGEATIIGDVSGPIGSAFMVIYALPDADGNATAILNSMEIPEEYLAVVGEEALFLALVADDGEIVQMFDRDVARNPRDGSGYNLWFFNDALTIAYSMLISGVGEGEAGPDFLARILGTLSVTG